MVRLNSSLVERILARDIGVWERKCIRVHRSVYVNIPSPVAKKLSLKTGKRGITIYLKLVLDERTGRLMYTIDPGV